MLLEWEKILVSGAGRGLGEGIARVCHQEVAHGAFADIRGEAAEEVANLGH
jgi:NAD(P)-dependent dehydrogenase (short-subunit alcohol dehydrogenase family)